MWAFFSRRLRTWLLLAVAVPVVGRLTRGAADKLDSRGASPRASRALRTVGRTADRLERRSRGAGRRFGRT